MICILNWKLAVQQKSSSAFSASVKVLATRASDCPGNGPVLHVPATTAAGRFFLSHAWLPWASALVCSWHVLWHYFLAHPPHPPIASVMYSLCLLPAEDICWSCQAFSSQYPCEGRKFSLISCIEVQVGSMWGLVACSRYHRQWVKMPEVLASEIWMHTQTQDHLCAGLKNHCSCCQSNTSKLN